MPDFSGGITSASVDLCSVSYEYYGTEGGRSGGVHGEDIFGFWPNKNKFRNCEFTIMFAEAKETLVWAHFFGFFFFHPPGSDSFGKHATKRQFYNNVCTLLRHNLHMHFELACKVHICVLENQILCIARLHHQHP